MRGLRGWLRFWISPVMPIHPHDERTYQIICAAMEVHRILHRGLKEELYCDASEVDSSYATFRTRVQCLVVWFTRTDRLAAATS